MYYLSNPKDKRKNNIISNSTVSARRFSATRPLGV